MTAQFRYVLQSTILACLLVPIATTASADALEDCRNLPAATALPACTLLVNDSKRPPAARAYSHVLRARAELDLSDLDAAAADLKAAFTLQPANNFGLRVRSRLYGLQGRNAEAREDLTRAIQLAPNPDAKYISYIERGNFFVRVADLPDARADFEVAIQLSPGKAAAYVGRAIVSKSGGKAAEALADLDRALAAEPSYWQAHIERGDILTTASKFAEAIAAYDRVLAVRPNDQRAQRGRAAARALMGNGGTVAAPAAPPATPVAPPATPSPAPQTQTPPAAPPTQAPSVAPAAPSTTVVAPPPAQPQPATVTTVTPPPAPPAPGTTQGRDGAVPAQTEARSAKLKEATDLKANGKHKEALEIYDELLRAAPTDPELLVEKGRTLLLMARWKDAADTFKIVINNQAAPPALKALAFDGQGEVLARNNQFEAAIQNTTVALQINPNLDNALFWRGFSHQTLGAFDKAVADFARAGELVPKAAHYQAWQALGYAGLGETAKAQAAIDRAFAIQPDNLIGITARARLRLSAGDLDAAEADINRLARQNALNPVALQTQQLIMLHRVLKSNDAVASRKP